MNIAKEEGLVKKFKLTTTIGTSNIPTFQVTNVIAMPILL